MRRRVWTALLLALTAASGTACVRFHGPEGLRRDLARTAGVRLERETGITVTRSGMWIARWGMRKGGEDDAFLRGVRRVEVGVYRVVDDRRGAAESLSAARSLEGWTPLVQVHDDRQDALVLVQKEKDGESIERLLVVAADDDEWTIVRIHGQLDEMLEQAMRFAFDEIGRPDLGDEAVTAQRSERG
jgi:hypothetical protein